ncbi:very short patch repair endonuclease [Rhodopseudomonas parapalustris]
MSKIRSQNTSPEMQVRRFLHLHGLRYRLHSKHLPGKPDITFPGRRACVFVHGCFWHGCPRCIDGTRPVKSNTQYWSGKIAGNRARDARHRAALKAEGWAVFTVWECEIQRPGRLQKLLEQIKRKKVASPIAPPKRPQKLSSGRFEGRTGDNADTRRLR